MSKVKIKFSMMFKKITHKEDLEIEIGPKENIRTLFEKLSKMFGSEFCEYIYDSQSEKFKSVTVLKNGTNIFILEGIKTQVQAGDYIVVLPPVAGGRC